jgi:PAS domain S-box-containing protein
MRLDCWKVPMAAWFTNWSIRTRTLLLPLAILAPAAAALAWFLAADVRQAREAADGRVSILANDSAAGLQRYLDRTRTTLERLAVRPLVRALDARRCDPLLAELVTLNPEYAALNVRDLEGRVVCSPVPNPVPQVNEQDHPWFAEVLRSGRFVAGNANLRPQNDRWVTVLSQPLHDAAGRMTGLLALPVDLLSLGDLLLAATPKDAVVSVVDRQRAVLLRSADAGTYVGKRPTLDQPDPGPGLHDGLFSAVGRDGVPRRYAISTLPGVEWKVVAGMPQAQVYAEYESTLSRSLGLGLGLALLALAAAWRLSTGIVRPIAGLAQAAADIAAGDNTVRASLVGPAEVAIVVRQFNHMLDARAQAAAALQQSEEQLRLFIKFAPSAIAMFDRDMRYLTYSHRWSAAYGLEEQDLTGRSHYEVFPDMPARWKEIHRACLAGAVESSEEDPFPRADGRLDWVRWSAHPWRNSAGEIGGIILFSEVITERKQAEAALRQSEADLRRLLERLPEAVVVIREARIGFVNDAAQRLLGATAADLLGRPALEIFRPGSLAVNPSRVLALRASGSAPPLIEEKILRADGTIRVVDTMAALIEDRGGSSILTVMRDVTSLQRAQAALVDSHADLQRLLAAQDSVQEDERKRVARELHDELQQALAVIRIDLGLIARRLTQGPVDAADLAGVADMVATVDAHAAHAIASTRRIVNDLRPHVLEDLGLEAALEMMALQLGQRAGMACQVEAQPAAREALLQAPAVTTCLYRVAQEALNNVLKHAQASTVRLDLTLVAADRVALRVQDNGKGFNTRQRHRQDAFGLQGMAERVRALGGTLRIESPPGGGTAIEVTLPLSGRVAAAAGTGRLSSARRQRAEDPAAADAGGPDFSTTQAVIDALAGNVAVLGPDGVIECVNRAWREFAQLNGAPGMAACGPGTDYLGVCRRSAPSDRGAMLVLQGLSAVLDGSSPVFVSEYPCDAPHEQRWFRLHAAPMRGGRLLVTHFDLTEWVDRRALDARETA